MPFTHITEGAASAGELRPGHRFVACTMVGRFGFNDVMTIDEIEPPTSSGAGHARIVKSGRLILGTVRLTVGPRGTGRSGSTVLWVQDFGLGRFPPAVGLAAFWLARIGYPATLRRLLRG